MPTYEYLCEKCEHEFEREQRISDPPIRTCPKCRSRKVKKLISRTSFVLKGGGWYSDLYATPKDAAKDKGAGDSDAASGEAKSDAKSESKSDASKDEKPGDSKKPSPEPPTKSSKKGKSAA